MRNGRQPRSFSHQQGLAAGLDDRPGNLRDGQRSKNILLALQTRWQRALGSRLKREPDAGMYGFIKKTVSHDHN